MSENNNGFSTGATGSAGDSILGKLYNRHTNKSYIVNQNSRHMVASLKSMAERKRQGSAQSGLFDSSSVSALGIGDLDNDTLKRMAYNGQIEVMDPDNWSGLTVKWANGWNADRYRAGSNTFDFPLIETKRTKVSPTGRDVRQVNGDGDSYDKNGFLIQNEYDDSYLRKQYYPYYQEYMENKGSYNQGPNDTLYRRAYVDAIIAAKEGDADKFYALKPFAERDIEVRQYGTKYGKYAAAHDFNEHAELGTKYDKEVDDDTFASMYDYEKKMFRYLRSKYGKDVAEEYVDYIGVKSGLTARVGKARAEEIEASRGGAWGDLDYWLANKGLAFESGWDNSMQGYKQLFSAKAVRPTAAQYADAYFSADLTGADKVAYGIVQQVGNMAPMILVTTAATAMGVPAPVVSVFGATMVGASAAGNAYTDALNRGYDADQALQYSFCIGASEALLQYFLGGLAKAGGLKAGAAMTKVAALDSALFRFAGSVAVKGGSEAFEENLQLFLEPLFNSMIFGEEYDVPTWEDIIYTSLVSFFSANLLEGGEIASITINGDGTNGISSDQTRELAIKYIADAIAKVTGKDAGVVASNIRATQAANAVDTANARYDLVDAALKGDKNSGSRKLAESIRAKIDAGEFDKISATEIGQLANMMRYEKITSKVEARKTARVDAGKAKLAEIFKPAKSKTEVAETSVAEDTELAKLETIQTENPDVTVVPDSVKLFMEAGDDSTTAARKAEILARILSGDTSITNSQLRKIDMQSQATRSVLEQVTGQAVPMTSHTQTLLDYAQSLVNQYAESNAEPDSAQAEIDAFAAKAAEQALSANQERAKSDTPVHAVTPAQAQGMDMRAVADAQDAAQAKASAEIAAQHAKDSAGTTPSGAPTETPTAGSVRLSDGTTVSKDKFIKSYRAANPNKGRAVAERMYADAVRHNAMGEAYPAAVLQKADSVAQDSAGAKKRSSLDAETSSVQDAAETSQANAEGKPSNAQDWTVKHMNYILSQRKGGPKVALSYDLAFNENGFYDKGTNTIYLNGKKLTSQFALTYTLGHELVHSVPESQRGGLVDSILEFGKKLHKEGWYETEYESTRDTYITHETKLESEKLAKKKGIKVSALSDADRAEARTKAEATVTKKFVREEMAADLMRELLTGTKGIIHLANESQQTRGWLSKLRTIAEKVMSVTRGKKDMAARALYNEAEALVDRMDAALKTERDSDTLDVENKEQGGKHSVDREAGTYGRADENQTGVYVSRSTGGGSGVYGSDTSEGRRGRVDVAGTESQGRAVTAESLRAAEVTPPDGSELKRAVDAAAEYAVEAHIIQHEAMRTDGKHRLGCASDGVIFIADDLSGKALDGVLVHEITHTMRQKGFWPYMSLVMRTETMLVPGEFTDKVLNDRAEYCRDYWDEYRGTDVELKYEDLDINQKADAIDELCAWMVESSELSDQIDKLDGYLFRDGKAFIAELRAILRQYKAEYGFAYNTETHLSAEADGGVSSMPETGEQRFSIEAEELIAELNESDIDDYSLPSYELQSRAWLLPEVVEIRNQKFTDTAGLPNRKALRDKVEKRLLANGSWDGEGYNGEVAIGHHADIVIGLPGSGKSSVAANPLSQKNRARIIDSDMAKEMLPGFDEGKGASSVHNESAKIRDRVMASTVERGENLVFVTVGSSYERLKHDIQRLYDEGYEIAVHYVDVTPKQALARSLRRFITENGEPGRYVPLDTVIQTADDLRANVRELAQTGLVEYFEVIDNRGSEPTYKAGTPKAVGEFGFKLHSAWNKDGETEIAGSWEESPTEGSREKPKVKTKGLTALEKQIAKLSKTKSFKNWFHDGNGELLDENTGLPRIFFHGTATAGYTRFIQQRKSEPGFWFAKHRHTSDAQYYTGHEIGDPETPEFVPVSAESWDEVEDFLYEHMPLFELEYSRKKGTYSVVEIDTGTALGEFEDSEEGIRQFNDSYQDMIQSSSAVEQYLAAGRHSDPPNPGMYRVFLSMKKPLVVHCGGKNWNRLSPFMVDDKRVQKAIIERSSNGLIGYIDPNRPVTVATRDFTGVAQEFGYDGVIFKDVIDGRSEFIRDGSAATLDAVYEIMEKYNCFGAPNADIALSFVEDTGVKNSKMSEEDKATVQAFLDSEESSVSSGEFMELPDDDFVVFDSSQIKSLHNTGSFDASNPDIRYSVDSTEPYKGSSEEVKYLPWDEQIDLFIGNSLNDVLRSSHDGKRKSVLYVMPEVSDLYAQMGLSNLPLVITQAHVGKLLTPRYDSNGNVIDNHAHDLTPDQVKRLPDMIRNPLIVFASDPRSDGRGGVNILTDEVDSQGNPIFVTIKADQPHYSYDSVEGPAHFVNAFARPNYVNYLRNAYRNGSVLYQSSEKVNANSLFRALTNRHSQQFGVDFDTIIRQKDPSVKPGDRRFSIDSEKKTKTGGNTGNVNPDTGYERGSVADSFMRIWNTGDREAALNVLEQTVQRLTEMQAEQAEKRKSDTLSATFRPAGKITEDVIARNKRVIEELIAKYGEMEQTSAAQQEVHLPKQRDDKTKTRGFLQTAAAAEVTPEAVLNEFERAIVEGDAGATYVPIGDPGTLRRATEALEKEGFDSLLSQWEGKFEAGDALTKDDIAKAEQLYVEACNNRDTITAMKLAAQISVAGTQAGQTVQALTLLKKMTPSGNLYYIQKAVDRLNKGQKGKHKDIVINEQLAKRLLEAETQEEIQAALDAICQDLADQMPVTLMDKWNTWRYLAMLGNPRTHIRNLMGNAVFTPARLMKDMLGAGLEKMLPQDQRTKAFTISAELRDFAKQDAEAMKDILRGGGKYNPADMIRDKRRIFRSGVLNAAEQFNSSMLEAEDWLFLKSAYSRALGSFLSARGTTVDAVSGANSTVEGRALLEEARAYAVKEAQKATYRDMSKVAGTINHLKRNTGLVGEVFLEGLVPFTKTPINIVKRGIEYSPAGLIKGVVDMGTKVRKGDMRAAEALDEICAGLTGTGILLLGSLLTKLGVLVPGHGDDDEDEFDELQGVQEYSLRIGDLTFTIDWTAPVALPLFVGSEIYTVLAADADEDVNVLDAILDGVTTMFEPMLSLSMLDGLNKTLSANKYGEEDDALYNILATVATSYFSQGVPTLFGQIARTVDDSRRVSFTPKGAGKIESWLSRAFQTNVLGKIPVAAEGRMLYIDNWGRADTESNILMRAFENFISPGYISEVKTTAVDSELERLAKATGDNGVFPDRAAKYFSVDNETYAMTQEEYQAHLIERGQHSYQLVNDIINSPMYAGLDDSVKAQAITLAYEYAAGIAKLHTNADYDPDLWMLNLYSLETGGGDAAEYLLLRAQSKVGGYSLTENALSNGSLSSTDVVNIAVMETNMPDSFTDPYATGYEYVLTDEYKAQYESFYRQYLAEEYAYLVRDREYQQASASEKYEMFKDIKTRVGKLTREAMSDWLWDQGVESTPKN